MQGIHKVPASHPTSMAENCTLERDTVEKGNILLVEDEEDIQELLRFNLTKEGFSVRVAGSGEEALRAVQKQPPHLILLDLMLPGMNGLEVCRLLKRNDQTRAIPILMVSARGEEADVVAGLELGAEDYVAKPFSPRVLIARVRAVLRRLEQPSDDASGVISIRQLLVHPGRREVRLNDEPVPLTTTEFDVLRLLASRPGWVFTRGQIVDGVRGQDYHVTERSVDVQIVGLRRKLGPLGEEIETVRGVGYRFRE